MGTYNGTKKQKSNINNVERMDREINKCPISGQGHRKRLLRIFRQKAEKY